MKVLVATTCTPDDRKTVACVRSLRAGGAVADVGGDRLLGQAFHSRHMRRRILLPHPALGARSYVDAINRCASKYEWNAVLPTNDYTTQALVEHRERLDPALATALPDPEPFTLSRDKLRTAELARNLGLNAPATFAPRTEAEALEAGGAVGFPCVIKLRRGAGSVNRLYITNRDELLAAFRAPRPPSDPVFDFESLLVQEFVDGVPEDVCALFAHGEPRSAYTQRRIRTWPVDGGMGVVMESTHNPALLEQGLALMKALRWHGPIQAEFKVDRKTGKAYLLEINGRLWGALGLSTEIGLDFPLRTCRLAADGDIPACFQYRAGVRMRWPWPFAFLSAYRSPDGLAALRDFFEPRPDTCSDLRWSDPGPLIAETAYAARRGWDRMRRRWRPSLSG